MEKWVPADAAFLGRGMGRRKRNKKEKRTGRREERPERGAEMGEYLLMRPFWQLRR